jgi:hypothetical protein
VYCARSDAGTGSKSRLTPSAFLDLTVLEIAATSLVRLVALLSNVDIPV